MAGKDDVELTFDPQSFLQGLKKITDAMNNFESKTKDTGKKVDNSSSQMSSFMVAKGMIMAQALMGVFQKVFNFIKGGLPEIGKAFSISSDIIQRNLLYPLRKELAPILQKMLDWVRDHRAMFVQWGGVLVNVFRALTAIVKGFVAMFRALIEPIAAKLKEVFKGVGGDISDLFNVILFKITAVVMYLQVAFMPLISAIGDALAVMIGWVDNFFTGFSAGVEGIAEPFADIIAMFKELASVLRLSDDAVSSIGAEFQILGDFLGSTLYSILVAIAETIDGLTLSIKNIGLGMRELKAGVKGDFAEVARLRDQEKQNAEAYLKRSAERGKKIADKWGGFVDRTQANFSPNNNTSSKNVTANSKVVIENLEIKVDPSTDTKKTGEAFIEGMNKKNSDNIKKLLMNEAGAQGL